MLIKEVVVIRNKALNFMRFFNTFGVESLTEKPMSFNHDAIDCANCKKRFTSVFCKVENDTMEQINEEKICTPYKKGQIIFHEGSRPLGIYCVNRGKIKLVKLGEDGKEQILRLIKPGDLMGYRALLSGDKYSASAVVLEEAGICFIPKELFMGVLQKDGVLSMEIMKLLSDDLRKAEVSITHFAQKPVRERLAEALLFIKETYGFEADGKTIDLKISREDLANLVGTATETLEGKKIEILNLPKLVKIANIED
jgi:CRP/FNR family transcriptional regulator, polysaccharide utilization system transcription regulator